MKTFKMAIAASLTLLLASCGGSGGDSSGVNDDFVPDIKPDYENPLPQAKDYMTKYAKKMYIANQLEYEGTTYKPGSQFVIPKIPKGVVSKLGKVKIMDNNDRKAILEGEFAIYKTDLYVNAWVMTENKALYVGHKVMEEEVSHSFYFNKMREEKKILEYEGIAVSKDNSIYGNFFYQVDFDRLVGKGSIDVDVKGDETIAKVNLLETGLKNEGPILSFRGDVSVELKDGSKKEVPGGDYSLGTFGGYFQNVFGDLDNLSDGNADGPYKAPTRHYKVLTAGRVN